MSLSSNSEILSQATNGRKKAKHTGVLKHEGDAVAFVVGLDGDGVVVV